MTNPGSEKTVAALMDRWPTTAEFARDIGIKPTHAQTIRVRGRLPVEYWQRVIDAAAERGIRGVTAAFLLEIHKAEAVSS